MLVLSAHYKGFRHTTDEELAAHYEDHSKNTLNLKANEFVITSNNELLKYKKGELKVAEKRSFQSDLMGKVKGKNIEQEMALELLLDQDIKCVALTGQAGCGKTYLTGHAAFYQVEKNQYDKVFFTRNHVEIGKPLGALPGLVFDKIRPYCSSLMDQIGGPSMLLELTERNIIEVEAINYLQGRSLKNSFIIVDEAQNINREQIKMLITRVASGSKIVLCGDLHQIGNKEFTNGNNGLELLIEKFAGEGLFGMVELQDSVRSDLAKLAARLL